MRLKKETFQNINTHKYTAKQLSQIMDIPMSTMLMAIKRYGLEVRKHYLFKLTDEMKKQIDLLNDGTRTPHKIASIIGVPKHNVYNYLNYRKPKQVEITDFFRWEDYPFGIY